MIFQMIKDHAKASKGFKFCASFKPKFMRYIKFWSNFETEINGRVTPPKCAEYQIYLYKSLAYV